jgi:hypothetical protein
MQLQQPPRPVVLTGNKKALVWGVGHPDAAHSETWVVKAHANRRGQTSVYVGTRRQMGQVKLSIHEGCWQYAFTSEAMPRLPAGMDRRLATFTPPREVAPGWRRAAVILIPSTTLSKSASTIFGSAADVQWWPVPPAYQHLQFHVLVGEPDSDRHAVIEDAAGAVGFIRLASGHRVAVIATVVPLTAQELRMIAAERENPMSHPEWDDPVSIVVWGVCVDDGTPHLIDIAPTS